VDLGGKSKIEGDGNITAGRDIKIIAAYPQPPSNSDFGELDNVFRTEVNPTQSVLRLGKPTRFSTEALFTSLMRIGVSYQDATETTTRVVYLLADWRVQSSQADWIPTTADIRTAVMRVFVALANDKKYESEQVHLWFTSYVRRYGNPHNDCIKVIDHEKYVDLNYEYVSEVVLPHLLSRVVGLDRTDNPLERFSTTAFPRQTRDHMAKAVVEYTRELNVFSIRYKTLINLLQDYILEPPHPWIVTPQTMDRITNYNIERANAHFDDLGQGGREYGFEYSAKECMQHICAAVLSKYGCFLGVDQKYGLFELKRLLDLRAVSPELWASCRLAQLFDDLRRAKVDMSMFVRLLDSARNLWHSPPRTKRDEQFFHCARNLMRVSKQLLEYAPPLVEVAGDA
jgi:hypothetical protein